MSRELKALQIVIVMFLTTLSLSTHNSNGELISEGATVFDASGWTVLTNTTKHSYGQVIINAPVHLKNNNFSIDFLFGIVPEHRHSASHGMALVLSPTTHLFPGASSDQYLGLFNETNNGNVSNSLIAVELDIHKDDEFGDIDDNHIGININGLRSVVSASAGYYDDKDGSFKNLSLISGKVMRLSVVYSLLDKQLNVTLSPAEFSLPPKRPLLSLKQDLSQFLAEEMYYGFTAATGSTGAIHYMLSMFGTDDPENPQWDHRPVPILPPYPKEPSHRTRTVLVVCLTLSVAVALAASWFGSVFYLRHKKVKEVLEEWEIQYGPHRFAYKELFDATKGFKEKQLLGNGGFGHVYRGTLAGGSGAEIAVKRTSQGSSQGKTEFLAEISTIGRLRHPNLVRLLGYCRHKEDLFLVYDFMPNGSLDKYINNRNENDQERLTWEQRFKIIKDIASALVYLHQEWAQVIIHRDIKPANVLIDHEMSARLGDFGLAKLYDQGIDPQTSRVAGTFGYIAPEFLRTGRATTSTDVYAFGLVMLEVACGRRLLERREEEEAKNEEVLVDWILELWENGKIFDAAEESIRREQNRREVELVLKLGVLCSHQADSIRPDMSTVMRILNGVLQLPEYLLDVVRDEKLRGRPEISMEVLRVDSMSTLMITHSFTSHGR